MRKLLSLLLGLLLLAGTAVPAGAAGAVPVSHWPLTVTDQTGRPVEGAEIEAYHLGNGLAAILTTRPDGTVAAAPGSDTDGLWFFRVWAPGYRTLETGWARLATYRFQPLRLAPLVGNLEISARDSDGTAVAGMVLLIAPDGRRAGLEPIQSGQVSYKDLSRGKYRALITAPGFVPAAGVATVLPGQTAALSLTLTRSGFTVSGAVSDSVTGLALPGATVQVVGADKQASGTTTTGDNGRFLIPMPQGVPGAYSLRVTARGYQMAETQPVTLAAGSRQEWNETTLSPLTTTVSGTVQDAAGLKLTNAPIVLELKGYGEVADSRTDSDGFFRFDGIATTPGALFRVSSRASNNQFDGPWMELKVGAPNQVSLKNSERDYMVMGHGKVSGLVTTPSGEGLADVTVTLSRVGDRGYTVQTSTDGSFRFDDIPATEIGTWSFTPYTVRLSKKGYAAIREFTQADQEATTLAVANGELSTLRAVLHPQQAILHGQVADGKGQPITNARVTLRPDGYGDEILAVTDAAGTYSLKDVPVSPVNRYLLQAVAPGFLAPIPADVTDAVTGLTTLPTVKLTPETATITGHVLQADGTALDKATVALQDPAGALVGQAETDAAGFYRIDKVLPHWGEVTMTALRPGWGTAVSEITAPPAPGESLTRDLVLFPVTAALSGRVLNAAGTPVPGVTVELLAEGQGVMESVQTDSLGQYRFAQVLTDEPGWFWLRIRPSDGRFGGSLTHGTEMVPLLRPEPGEETVTDLLMN